MMISRRSLLGVVATAPIVAAPLAADGPTYEIGVDVARFGGDTTALHVCERNGDVRRCVQTVSLDGSLREIADAVARAADAAGTRTVIMNVSGVAFFVADRLTERGYSVRRVSVGRHVGGAAQ